MRKFNSRNAFNLSNEHKLTCNMGQLIPVMCEEVLPNDTFKVSTDMVVRFAPMLAPIMHNIDVYVHYFFIPNRLVFDDWEDFITGGEKGTDATVAPTIAAPADGFAVGSLGDYFGIPTGVTGFSVSALPFRCYALVYNEWYRNEWLQDEVALSTASGVDSTTNTTLLKRLWENDRFTSSLPDVQKGPQVNLPLGRSAPLVGASLDSSQMPAGYTLDSGLVDKPLAVAHQFLSPTDYTTIYAKDTPTGGLGAAKAVGLEVDLANATAATINDMRRAFQVQRWLEKNARSGSRYVESILAHFGIRSPDARLQRPEYLGGGRSQVLVSEVLQTSADDNQPTPQGNMAGHGVSVQRSRQFRRRFSEHGFILGLLSIMPRTNYYQGLSRMWTRATRYDYYWPVFAHLGEDAVYNRELYLQNDNVVDDDGNVVNNKVFGYQPRYDEYRHRLSTIHGEFRTSLAFWHLARSFDSLPVLNENFIQCNPSTRVFAVIDETITHNCWIDLYNNVRAIRPIPRKGVPGFIDHD